MHGFLDFQLAGAMLQSTMLAGVSAAIALALDIEIGFIDRLFAAPIARASFVLGRLAATAVMGAISALWFLAVGLVFGAHIEGGVAGRAGRDRAGGAERDRVRHARRRARAQGARAPSVAQGIFPLVFVILFLSSAFFPENLLLEPARTIAEWNPLSLIADGLRDPIISDLSLRPTLEALGGIAIVGGHRLGAAASGA